MSTMSTLSVAPGTNDTAKVGTSLLDNNDDQDQTILESKPLANDSTVSAKPHIPSVSASAVLGESANMPEGTPQCRGHDFDQSTELDSIMESLRTTGFQATNLALAVDQIREMRSWRLSSVEWKQGDDPALQAPEVRAKDSSPHLFCLYI
jgi:deoxyhypusine synthase